MVGERWVNYLFQVGKTRLDHRLKQLGINFPVDRQLDRFLERIALFELRRELMQDILIPWSNQHMLVGC